MGLGEELESLIEDGPTESKFRTDLFSVLRELRDETWGRSPGEIRADILDLKCDHPLLNFVIGLSRWEENESYEEGAELAIEGLRESVELALDQDWDGVAPTVIVERIKLLGHLSHSDELEEAINVGVDFLVDREESIPIGPVLDIIDAVIENMNTIQGTDTIDTLLQYLEAHAEKAIQANDFINYRHLWRRNLRIRRGADGVDIQPARDAIIGSYNQQIVFLKDRDEHSLRGNFAHEAIVECVEWIDEEQRVEWEQEFLNGNRESIEQMAEFVHEPSEEEVTKLDDQIEGIIERFGIQKEDSHAVDAILWLINHDVFKPSIDTAREISAGSITNIIQTRTVTQEGESYSQDEASGDRPQSYGGMVQFTQNIRQTVYYRLQNRELIDQGDFFILFNGREELSSDNLAYLTDFVIHLFDHDHTAATYIGMAQLEAVLRRLMAKHGRSTMQLDSETGELKRRSLSGLLYQIEEDVDEDWLMYMKYWYADLSGQNVRNKIAHGHLPYSNAQWGMSVMILFDILQTFLEFDVAYP